MCAVCSLRSPSPRHTHTHTNQMHVIFVAIIRCSRHGCHGHVATPAANHCRHSLVAEICSIIYGVCVKLLYCHYSACFAIAAAASGCRWCLPLELDARVNSFRKAANETTKAMQSVRQREEGKKVANAFQFILWPGTCESSLDMCANARIRLVVVHWLQDTTFPPIPPSLKCNKYVFFPVFSLLFSRA